MQEVKTQQSDTRKGLKRFNVEGWEGDIEGGVRTIQISEGGQS